MKKRRGNQSPAKVGIQQAPVADMATHVKRAEKAAVQRMEEINYLAERRSASSLILPFKPSFFIHQIFPILIYPLVNRE